MSGAPPEGGQEAKAGRCGRGLTALGLTGAHTGLGDLLVSTAAAPLTTRGCFGASVAEVPPPAGVAPFLFPCVSQEARFRQESS